MRTPVRHSFPARACKLPRHPSLASSMVRFICAIRLTNFFDLSNIRVEPWGAGEMLGAWRWSRNMPFQFDGQPALGADLLFACHFSTPPKNVLQFPRERRLPAWVCAELRSLCGVSQDGDFRAARVGRTLRAQITRARKRRAWLGRETAAADSAAAHEFRAVHS